MLDHKLVPHTCDTSSTNKNNHYSKVIISPLLPRNPRGHRLWFSIRVGQLLDTCPVTSYRKDLEINLKCKEARLFSFRQTPVVESSPRRICNKLWLHGSTSQKTHPNYCSQSVIAASKKVAIQHLRRSS